MKYTYIICFLTLINFSVFSQDEAIPTERKTALTVGFLQGGGSLLGMDLEQVLYKKLAVQVGFGLVGFGAGINYHLQPSIRSSFFSIQYWNQGIGESFVQNAIGPCFVYRSKKWFTCQLGFAKTLSQGPAFPKSMTQPPVMLTYAIGLYLPL